MQSSVELPRASGEGRSRVWKHVRGALIAAHVVAVSCMALPSPSGVLVESAWRDATVRDEFRAWSSILRRIGIDLGEAELASALWEATKAWSKWHAALTAPFLPYARLCGTRQSWRMFVAPHRHPSRLLVEVDDQDAWRTVYLEGSAAHAWRVQQFRGDRMRDIVFRYSWPKYTRSYRRFVDWVAIEAARDFPGATRVRVSWLKYKTLGPAQVRRGEHPEQRSWGDEIRVVDGRSR